MDAFDKTFPRRAPMTASEAQAVVSAMLADTPRNARIKLWQTAIKIGNLTDAAKDVYRAALTDDAEGGAA